MSDLAIQVQGVGKRFHLGEAVSAKRLWRRLKTRAAAFRYNQPHEDPDTFWALRDINFEVQRGEVIGIIGHNGAGKSTLLKILSRITEPSEGQITIYGRVASLLEVGTGFHLELTGRENIYLNGAILGMTTAEINRKFDEIIDFAEVEKFLDTPVKHYSSGMRVRLGFAVAAHLEPEILIIDEVLSVGDATFQRKCMGKMSDVAGRGRTVLFVSHSMPAVRSLCQRVICLKSGRVVDQGSAAEVVERYIDETNQVRAEHAAEMVWNEAEGPGQPPLRLRAIQLLDDADQLRSVFKPQEAVTVRITYELTEELAGFHFVMHLLTSDREVAFAGTDQAVRLNRTDLDEPGMYVSTCRIPGGLLNEEAYRIVLSGGVLRNPKKKRLLPETEFLIMTVAGLSNSGAMPRAGWRWPGVVCPRLDWSLDRQILAPSK